MLKVLGVMVRGGDIIDMIVSCSILPSRCCGVKVVSVLSESSELVVSYNSRKVIVPVNCIFYIDVVKRSIKEKECKRRKKVWI